MPSALSPGPVHRLIAADVHRVPPPFRAYAVRSEEPGHAGQARAPYGRVHLVRTAFLDADALARMAADGHSRVSVQAFSDIDHANANLRELTALAPQGTDLLEGIAGALELTGVLGAETADDIADDTADDTAEGFADYRRSVAGRIDYLAACGAGFHNDVARHWSRCLFWVLALQAADVEFVMPHAGVRCAVVPGDLIVFDPSMAHGLCRPRDHGQAVAASFETGEHSSMHSGKQDRWQIFLTGELLLSDARWAALGAPWQPVEEHARRGALDLMVATFDERSGAIQRLHSLRDCMRRSTCLVDEMAD